MRYLFGMLMAVMLCSCDCEEYFACRDSSTLVGTDELLENVWLQVPNVLSDKEFSHILVHTFPLDSFDLPAIVAFEFEIEIDNGFTYSTSDTSFIATNGRYISIPQDDMYEIGQYREGYASYSFRLFLEDLEGFIGVEDGELLLVTCERLGSGLVGDRECRFSQQIFPCDGFCPPAHICFN